MSDKGETFMLKGSFSRCLIVCLSLLLVVSEVGRVAPQTYMEQMRWGLVSWKGDNRPYHQIRTNIDRLVAQGKKPAYLLPNAYRLAQQDLRNPKAKFTWIYTAYQTMRQNRPVNPQKVQALLDAMNEDGSPQVYDWTRLQFLLHIENYTSPDILIPIGERLLRHDPKDYFVKYALTVPLGESQQPMNNQRAIEYAQDLIRMNPKSSQYRSGLGQAYYSIWRRTRNSLHRQRAIAEYQMFLKLAPQDDYLRPDVKRVIARLQRAK